jgi:tight adherence protein B
MRIVGVALAGVSISLLFWLVHRILTSAWCKYRDSLNADAETQLAEMFVFIDLSLFWPLLVALGVSLGFLVWLLSDSVALSAVVALGVLTVPRAALAKARVARATRLDRQLPDALRMIAGSLAAGASFSSALNAIARDLYPPLSQELSLVLREQRVGIPLQDALNNFRLRVDTDSVAQVTTLLRVGVESGGSLSALVDRLASSLEAQQHMELKVDMLTTQGKMQAVVIGVLPVLLLVVLCWIDSAAMHLALSTNAGRAVLVLIVMLEVLGVVWLRAVLREISA